MGKVVVQWPVAYLSILRRQLATHIWRQLEVMPKMETQSHVPLRVREALSRICWHGNPEGADASPCRSKHPCCKGWARSTVERHSFQRIKPTHNSSEKA
jgi:hypothetical protein